MLLCPKCKSKLIKDEKTFYCEHHHSYDISKRGYVNLMPAMHKQSGDDKNMVKARKQFLSHQYYEVLRNALADMISQLPIQTLLDAGCGEGYYTNYLQLENPSLQMLGFDVSKYAIDEACKARSNVQYIVGSVFHLPIQDESMDALLSVFAPFDAQEIHRILTKEGYFICVSPGKRHLMGLKKILYSDIYENQDDIVELPGFKLQKRVEVHDIIHVNCADIWALFQMTPYFWKTSKQGSEALKQITTLTTEIAFHIDMYQKIDE